MQKSRKAEIARAANRIRSPEARHDACDGVSSPPLVVAHGQKFIQKISGYGKKISYDKGHVFFSQGQEPRGVFLLLDGSAKLSTASHGGNSLILGFVEPGSILGLAANILERAHEISAEAVTRCTAIPLSRDALLGLANEDAETALNVAAMLGKESFKLVDRVRIIGLSDSAPQRLASFLLSLRQANGGSRQTQINLAGMTEDEFGQMVGLCRETISRLLSLFRKKRVLSREHPGVIVRDWEALRKIAARSKAPPKRNARPPTTLES